MKNHGRYHHLRVDWVGESSTQSITLCGVEGEDIGTGQSACPVPMNFHSPVPTHYSTASVVGLPSPRPASSSRKRALRRSPGAASSAPPTPRT